MEEMIQKHTLFVLKTVGSLKYQIIKKFYKKKFKTEFPKLFCKWPPLEKFKKPWPPSTRLLKNTIKTLYFFPCSSSATREYLV